MQQRKKLLKLRKGGHFNPKLAVYDAQELFLSKQSDHAIS